jgi:hypothetical protein
MKKTKSMIEHMRNRNSMQKGPGDPPIGNAKKPTYSDSLNAHNSFIDVMKTRKKAINAQKDYSNTSFSDTSYNRKFANFEKTNKELGSAIAKNHEFAKSSGIKPERTVTLKSFGNIGTRKEKVTNKNEPFTGYKKQKVDPSYARNTQVDINAYSFTKPKERTNTITVKPMSADEVVRRKKDYEKQTGKPYKPRTK